MILSAVLASIICFPPKALSLGELQLRQRSLYSGVVGVEFGNLLFEDAKRVGTGIVRIGEWSRVARTELIYSQGGG